MLAQYVAAELQHAAALLILLPTSNNCSLFSVHPLYSCTFNHASWDSYRWIAGHSIQVEIRWIGTQTFMVLRGSTLMTAVLPSLLFLHHHDADICCLEWDVSTAPTGWVVMALVTPNFSFSAIIRSKFCLCNTFVYSQGHSCQCHLCFCLILISSC